MANQGNSARPIYVLPTEGGAVEGRDRVSLSVVLGYLWVSRIWIMVFAVFGLMAGLLAFSVSTKIYHSETLLSATQQDRTSSSLGGLASQLAGATSLMGVSLNSGNTLKTEALTVLRSPGFLKYFIQKHNLMPILYSKIWDANSKSWTVADPSKIPTLADAELYFSTRILAVQDDKSTGIVTVAVEWKDREAAAQWANELISDLNEALRSRAVAESADSISYLNRVLRGGDVPDVEQQAIYNLIEGQMATSMMANVRKQYALKVLDPAAPADPDNFVRPNLLLLLSGGLFSSVVFGLVLRYVARARFVGWWQNIRRRVTGASESVHTH